MQSVGPYGGVTADPNVAPTNASDSRILACDARGVLWTRLSAGSIALAGLADNADDVAVTAVLNRLPVVSRGYLFDGVAYDRARALSAANISAAAPLGAALVTQVGEWSIQASPAVGAQATIARAAIAAQRHVCKGFSLTLNAVAAIVVPVVVNLRDGASGAGTILWSGRFTAPAGTTVVFARENLNIFGTVNTAMTMEFAAAPAGTDFQNVALNGYTTA